MRFRVTSLVVASILASTVSVTAHAQQTLSPCADPVAQQLKDQIKALDSMPNVKSFSCAAMEEVAPGISNYVFFNDSTRQVVDIVFEFSTPKSAVALGIRYSNGKCPATRCIRGWLNDAYLATGYGKLGSSWTSIWEESPNLTVQKTVEQFRDALSKRRP